MNDSTGFDELLEFPTDYIFKAFGPNDEEFILSVKNAVSRITPVPADAMKKKLSREGKYVSISIVVRLYNLEQLKNIYNELQGVRRLKYLL